MYKAPPLPKGKLPRLPLLFCIYLNWVKWRFHEKFSLVKDRKGFTFIDNILLCADCPVAATEFFNFFNHDVWMNVGKTAIHAMGQASDFSVCQSHLSTFSNSGAPHVSDKLLAVDSRVQALGITTPLRDRSRAISQTSQVQAMHESVNDNKGWPRLNSIIAVIVFCSIVVHGLTFGNLACCTRSL